MKILSFQLLLFLICANHNVLPSHLEASGVSKHHIWSLDHNLISCLFSILSITPFYYAYILILISEFNEDEYKSAKVDPIAQFSKPVAVLISNLPSYITCLQCTS